MSFLTLTHQLLHELGEDATVRVTHAHCVLVDIDARLVDATELELVHQVVVHLFGVYCHARLTGVERSVNDRQDLPERSGFSIFSWFSLPTLTAI